jgi:hypothetical protein
MAPDPPPAPGASLWSRPWILLLQTGQLLDVDLHKQYQETTPAGTLLPCTEGVGSLSRRLSAPPLRRATHVAPYNRRFSFAPSTQSKKICPPRVQRVREATDVIRTDETASR